jgi:phage baseplate assembly protein W
LIELNGLEPWLEKIGRGDLVFLCNPNNPTGNLLSPEELEHIIIQTGKRGAWLVLDESFMDFIIGDQKYTCRPLLNQYDNLIITHSLTKFYAIPGLRLGFAFAHPHLTVKLHTAKDPWNVNLLAQAAGVANIKQALILRLSTRYGELPMHSDYGSDFPDMIGWSKTSANLTKMKLEIMETFKKDARVSNVMDCTITSITGGVKITCNILLTTPNASFVFNETIAA